MESPAFTWIAPWIPPEQPDLARLAMVAADAAGVRDLRAWPELRKGGVGFGQLPPFLSWQGLAGDQHHLVLLQARELGGLVPGARMLPLPGGWLGALDLEDLARPLACHPDFPGGAAVHVVHLPGPGRAQVRSVGPPGPGMVRAVLERLTGWPTWDWV
jgi:hypothetical protein